jgi:hypothetical protein
MTANQPTDTQHWIRRVTLLFVLICVIAISVGCTSYRDPRAEVIITSNRDDATIYLVPIDKTLTQPLSHSALKEYNMGSTSSRRGVWVHHGYYWLVLEKNGAWSDPVEFEVRIDYLNKVHVDF